VTPEVRARGLEAIDALRYRHSRLARHLRTERAPVLGLIIPEVQSFFFCVARAA
jgi:DNA-binding LacI/PurR family transcriptional regulator